MLGSRQRHAPEQVAGLRSLAEALPPEAPVPVPSSWLRELLTHGSPAPQLPTPAERMLTAEEVAPLLGTTVRWVYNHVDQLGGRRLSPRCLRFPESAIRRRMERR